jgi:hypothetical protein
LGIARPDPVPGVLLYLDESNVPGGKVITGQPSPYPLPGKGTWDAIGWSAPHSEGRREKILEKVKAVTLVML